MDRPVQTLDPENFLYSDEVWARELQSTLA
jgi:hypothetical protein